MRVRDVLRRRPITVTYSEPIRKCAKVMRDHNVGLLVITNQEGRLLGVVSERDIVHAIANEIDLNLPVAKIMKYPVITVRLDDPLWRAAKLMLDYGIRHLVVVEGDVVVGVLSVRDLINHEKLLKLMAEIVY